MAVQQQLILPMLQAIADRGGEAKPADLYPDVAERAGVPPADRDAMVANADGRPRWNAYHRDLRWAQQIAKLRGLIDTPQRGIWAITEKGRDNLQTIRPGYRLVIFQTPLGFAICAHADEVDRFVEPESIQAIVTSPPYPGVDKPYGCQADVQAWIDWMLRVTERWIPLLTPDGSIMLNLAPNLFRPGSPTVEPYIQRLTLALIDKLGLHLAQEIDWHNPAKMPAPAQWVTVEKIRLVPSTERIIWTSKSERPFADNRAVRKPYSASMRRLLAAGGQQPHQARPSGHVLSPGAFATDNGGAIAHSLLVAANTSSNDDYIRAQKAAGEPVHPARFPMELPKFCIGLATREGDTVADFFLGSGTTAQAAEQLGRRWVGTDRSATYLRGAARRLGATPLV